MRLILPVLLLVLVTGCASVATPIASTPTPVPSASPAPLPDLAPPAGQAWFGMNLDWAIDSVAEASERLGATPSVWVQFVRFPLDDAGRGNLDAFVDQIAAVDGIGLVTLEPHDGLGSPSHASPC